MTRYLIDTDVIIDALRGNTKAEHFIKEKSDIINISVLTIAELYAGSRNKNEAQALAEFLTLFPKIELTESITQKGGIYRHRYSKSHGTGLVDALIAATAEAISATLVTLNIKHYPMLDKIKIPYKK